VKSALVLFWARMGSINAWAQIGWPGPLLAELAGCARLQRRHSRAGPCTTGRRRAAAGDTPGL
jgi:hypothetical protein